MSAHDDFRRQLEGYGLTTAYIFYRMPDFRSVLQEFVWQDYDLHPEFPKLNEFLEYWEANLDGPLHSVSIVHHRLISPTEIRAIGEIKFH